MRSGVHSLPSQKARHRHNHNHNNSCQPIPLQSPATASHHAAALNRHQSNSFQSSLCHSRSQSSPLPAAAGLFHCRPIVNHSLCTAITPATVSPPLLEPSSVQPGGIAGRGAGLVAMYCDSRPTPATGHPGLVLRHVEAAGTSGHPQQMIWLS